MMKKSFYEAPEAELLLVKFEGNFCTTGLDSPGGLGDNDLGELDDENNG